MRTTIKSKKTVLLATICSAFIISCGSNDIIVDNPATYNFEREGVSTVSFSGQTTRISMATELINAMKVMDNLDEIALIEMYTNQTAAGGNADPYLDPALNESTKSIKSKVAASSDFFSSNTVEAAEIRADFQSWITAQVQEVAPRRNEIAEPGFAGQTGNARYVNGKGLEYNQAVTKSLIGALMTDQICNNYLSTTVLDAGNNIADNDSELTSEGKSYTNMEHKWDEAYGYLFSASTDAANPLETLGEGSFLNKYLSRVDGDSDFAGIASDIYEAFKLGRAAIVAGDYDTRDKQAEIIKEKISEVIAIRAIYYMQAGKNKIANSTNRSLAFHDLSEGFGFVYSLRFTRQSDRNESYFSKEEVDGFIEKLTTGNGFWDVETFTLDEISEDIADKFSFTVAQAAQ